MLGESLSSLRQQMLERTENPFFGSFIISWLLWNYQAVLVLFSDMNVIGKLNFIDSALYPTTWDILIRGLGLPLLTAALYIFVYPFPSRWIFRYWKQQQIKNRDAKNEIEKNVLLTIEESLTLTERVISAEKKLKEIRAEHDKEKSELEEIVRELHERNLILEASLPSQDAVDDDNTNRYKAPVAAKISNFKILRDKDGQYRSILTAYGNTLLTSEGFPDEISAVDSVEEIKAALQFESNFKKMKTMTGGHYFTLTGKIRNIIGTSPSYESESELDRAISLVKRLAVI